MPPRPTRQPSHSICSRSMTTPRPSRSAARERRHRSCGQQDHYTFSLSSPAELYLDALSDDNAALTWTLTGPRGSRRAEVSPVHRMMHCRPGRARRLQVDRGRLRRRHRRLRVPADGRGGRRHHDPPGHPGERDARPRNETDLYRFSAAAGDQLLFRTRASAGREHLLVARGSLWPGVFQNNYAGYDTGPWTLSVTGTYTLLLNGSNPSGTPAGMRSSLSSRQYSSAPFTGTPLTPGK